MSPKTFKDCTDLHAQGYAVNLGCVAGWVVAHGVSHWGVMNVPSETALVRNVSCEIAPVSEVLARIK